MGPGAYTAQVLFETNPLTPWNPESYAMSIEAPDTGPPDPLGLWNGLFVQ